MTREAEWGESHLLFQDSSVASNPFHTKDLGLPLDSVNFDRNSSSVEARNNYNALVSIPVVL